HEQLVQHQYAGVQGRGLSRTHEAGSPCGDDDTRPEIGPACVFTRKDAPRRDRVRPIVLSYQPSTSGCKEADEVNEWQVLKMWRRVTETQGGRVRLLSTMSICSRSGEETAFEEVKDMPAVEIPSCFAHVGVFCSRHEQQLTRAVPEGEETLCLLGR